jgi:Uma2 family endonuclease
MAAREQAFLTPEQYLEIERLAAYKSEYISGQMFAMAGGSPTHSLIAMNIGVELGTRLRGTSCRVYNSDLRVAFEATNLYTYPDVTVSCERPTYVGSQSDALTNPTLIVEVLSPSTELYDRGEKFAHYQRSATLAEYVLVAQDHARVERYTRTSEGGWLLFVAEGFDSTIELLSIDVTLALSDIYANVEFQDTPKTVRFSS